MYIFPCRRIRYNKTITINAHIDCANNSKCSVRDILLAINQGAFLCFFFYLHEELGNVQVTLLLLFVWSLSCGCCWSKRDSTEVDGSLLTHPATTKMQLSTTAAPREDHAKFMLSPATIVGSPLSLLLWGGAVSIISTDDKSCCMPLTPPKMTM